MNHSVLVFFIHLSTTPRGIDTRTLSICYYLVTYTLAVKNSLLRGNHSPYSIAELLQAVVCHALMGSCSRALATPMGYCSCTCGLLQATIYCDCMVQPTLAMIAGTFKNPATCFFQNLSPKRFKILFF